jgi:hypothetical protein
MNYLSSVGVTAKRGVEGQCWNRFEEKEREGKGDVTALK